MRAERPSQVVRCEVLASWRGLDLVPRDGTWDLVPRAVPVGPMRGLMTGVAAGATGLSLAEVEALLTQPLDALPADPRAAILHEVAAHLERAERQAAAAPPGSRRRHRAEDVIERLAWFHAELLAGRGDAIALPTLQRILAELVLPLLAHDEDP